MLPFSPRHKLSDQRATFSSSSKIQTAHSSYTNFNFAWDNFSIVVTTERGREVGLGLLFPLFVSYSFFGPEINSSAFSFRVNIRYRLFLLIYHMHINMYICLTACFGYVVSSPPASCTYHSLTPRVKVQWKGISTKSILFFCHPAKFMHDAVF